MDIEGGRFQFARKSSHVFLVLGLWISLAGNNRLLRVAAERCYCFRKIFSIAFPFANSSISLSR